MSGNLTGCERADALASLLLEARAARRQLRAADLPQPADIDEAMHVQARIARTLEADVRAWKVGMPATIAVAAPLYPFILAQQDVATSIAWGERLGVEAELAVRLKRDIERPQGSAWTRSMILDCIEGVYLGIEPIGGRLKEGNASAFPLYLADSLDNAGYILGPRLSDDIVDRVAAGEVEIRISGKAHWQGRATHAHADPLHFLVSYANAQIDHLGGLKAGQIVTTGSLCGSVAVEAPGPVRFEFDRDYCMDLRVEI